MRVRLVPSTIEGGGTNNLLFCVGGGRYWRQMMDQDTGPLWLPPPPFQSLSLCLSFSILYHTQIRFLRAALLWRGVCRDCCVDAWQVVTEPFNGKILLPTFRSWQCYCSIHRLVGIWKEMNIKKQYILFGFCMFVVMGVSLVNGGEKMAWLNCGHI